MTEAVVEAFGLGFDGDHGPLFDGVNLSVQERELLVVTGAAGTGKSVLAGILAGVIAPHRGRVNFEGAPMPEVGQRGDRPAFAPQDGALVPELTAAESVGLPLQLRGIAAEEIDRRVDYWLGVLGLAACTDRAVADLSGGQRQRVSIARTFATQSDALIFDEPTAEIDAANRALVLSLMLDARDHGSAVIAISHDEDVATGANRLFDLTPASQMSAAAGSSFDSSA
ncbi:MAG: ATP-binding cassette domain-containing protein [Acidimicrobiales bacterium]